MIRVCFNTCRTSDVGSQASERFKCWYTQLEKACQINQTVLGANPCCF